eukprot:SAG31_NODE_13494_length_865_cov_1.261097_2_plen_132_part_01
MLGASVRTGSWIREVRSFQYSHLFFFLIFFTLYSHKFIVAVPLILRAPWILESVGKKTLAIAELVDIFPTLVDLSGLPTVPASERLEGISLLPVLRNPSDEVGVKAAAYSQYPRCPKYQGELWTLNVSADPY